MGSCIQVNLGAFTFSTNIGISPIFSLKIQIIIFLPDELLNYGRLLETTLNEADTTLPASPKISE